MAVPEAGLSEWMGLITYCAILGLEPKCTENLQQIDSGEEFGRSVVKLSNERLCSFTWKEQIKDCFNFFTLKKESIEVKINSVKN